MTARPDHCKSGIHVQEIYKENLYNCCINIIWRKKTPRICTCNDFYDLNLWKAAKYGEHILQNLATGSSRLSRVFSLGLGGLAKGRRMLLMAGRLSAIPLLGSSLKSLPPLNSRMASVHVLAGPYMSCPSRYGVISLSYACSVNMFIWIGGLIFLSEQ